MDFRLLVFFILLLLIGMLLEVSFKALHFKLTHSHYKENHFTYSKYFAYLFFPLMAIVYALFAINISLLKVFVVFALLGTFFEWLVGFSYHKVIGQRLWTYHRLSLGGYTSWLSIPFWGIAGLIFWILLQIIQI